VSEQHVKVSAALEKLVKEKGTAVTGVSLAYVIHDAPYGFPIAGVRKINPL
jgi:aryl-alcohol dehydrogenase-like predicted oxidoreductase